MQGVERLVHSYTAWGEVGQYTTLVSFGPAPALLLPVASGNVLLMLFPVRRPCSVDEVIEAVVEGESSQLLGEIHVALLRLLQADMEESHATGAIQVIPQI